MSTDWEFFGKLTDFRQVFGWDGWKSGGCRKQRYCELFKWHLGVLFLLLHLISSEICFYATDVIYITYIYTHTPLKWYLSLPVCYVFLSKTPWLLFWSKIKIPKNELEMTMSGLEDGEKNSELVFYLEEGGSSGSWMLGVDEKSLLGIRISGLIYLKFLL